MSTFVTEIVAVEPGAEVHVGASSFTVTEDRAVLVQDTAYVTPSVLDALERRGDVIIERGGA